MHHQLHIATDNQLPIATNTRVSSCCQASCYSFAHLLTIIRNKDRGGVAGGAAIARADMYCHQHVGPAESKISNLNPSGATFRKISGGQEQIRETAAPKKTIDKIVKLQVGQRA